MAMNAEISEKLEWYYLEAEETGQHTTKGPISERDIDVLWRTSGFISSTLLWKDGMNTWKPLNEIIELKEKLMESTKEMLEIANKKPVDVLGKKHPLPNKAAKEAEINIEKEVEKLIANSAYKNPSDGLWYIYDHDKKEWRTQDEDPNATFESLSTERSLQEKNSSLLDRSKKINKNEKPPVPISEEEMKKLEKLKKKTKKAAEKKKKKWYEPKINANIYVKGLPEDITFEEIKEFFSKAGVLRFDAKSGDQKIKLYKDDNNHFKGDALVSYVKEESVELAKEMLDQREIKPGFTISIERARFEQKGEVYIPRKKVEVDKINLIKQKTDQEKLLSWNEGPEDLEDKGLKIVILTNVFTLEESQQEENYFRDLEMDIRQECQEKLGPIQRMKIFEHNPLGVILLKFKNSGSAEECIKLMNGRWFSGRKLECFYYDGKTNYDRRVSLEEEEKRIEEFGKWLEGKE